MEKLDLTIDIQQVVKSVTLKKTVLSLAVSLGIFGTLTPLLFKQLDRESKTLFLLAGMIGNATASLLPRDTKDEKIKAFHEKISLENYRKQLGHEAFRINAVTEVRERNLLADFVDNDAKIPAFQKAFWANKFGVMPLITSFFIERGEPVQEALPEQPNAWQGTQPKIESVQRIEVKPGIEWIIDIAEKSTLPMEKRSNQHFKIDGGSQSGKSTFISLLIALISKMEGRMQVNLVDPKYPKTQWMIEPSFIGYEQVNDGIVAAISELNNRKKLCLEAAKSKQEQPNFTRYLLIIDEWDNIWSNGQGYAGLIDKKLALKIKGDLQRIFKESAAYNMSLILVGQSPLATDNGFSRSSLNSTTRIVLGNEALKWAQDPGFPFKGKAQALATELEDAIDNGDRVAMIAPNLGSAPYVKSIPQINLKELFDTKYSSPDSTSDETQELSHEQKAFLAIQQWAQDRQNKPTSTEVLEAWEKLTGKRLHEDGLRYLMEKLGL